LRACNVRLVLLFLSLYTAGSVLQVVGNFWLSRLSDNSKSESSNQPFLVYLTLGCLNCLLLLCADLLYVRTYVLSAQRFHDRLLDSVLHAPMRFFDATPLGRILNRFGKDLETVESKLPETFKVSVRQSFTVLSVLAVISLNTPWFLVPLVPLFGVYVAVQRVYVCFSRQVKRLESVSRSPIFAFFAESLNGMSTIRAFGAQERHVRHMNHLLDLNTRVLFNDLFGNRWLSLWLELLGTIIVLLASLLAVLAPRRTITPGLAGLSITYALNVNIYLTYFQWYDRCCDVD
jgi:ABC-type multidrug transport system fused ATPase/permease subunit